VTAVSDGTVPDPLDQPDFRAQFAALRTWAWLDTPGSPPGAAPVLRALRDALQSWEEGEFSWRDWDWAAEESRAAFARYAGVASKRVSVLGSVAEGAATVAASLPPGPIVVADEEFRSTLFPWLSLDPDRNPLVRVPARDGITRTEDLVAAVRPGTVLCAVSDTLTSNGVRPDFAALREATGAVGARLFVDLTQSFGVLEFDVEGVAPDFVAVHGYKGMLCPRGAAWMVTRSDRLAELSPLLPSWKSTAPPFGYFGGELELPADASRMDTSPAWFSWIGSLAAIDLLSRLDRAAVHAHTTSLAARWWEEAQELGYRPITPQQTTHISVVDIGTRDLPTLTARLADRGVKAQLAGTRLRIGVHYFNDDSDIVRTLDAMAF
jgi:selenocysteine lyase/cysteine desulfurase